MRGLVLILLVCSLYSFGQKGVYDPVADSLSYTYFMDGKVRELMALVRKEKRKGVDFYYLRMRAGITCYNLRRYEGALVHFEKALEMNPNDTLAQEYLFFSRQNTLRTDDARAFASALPESRTRRWGFDPRMEKSALVTAGYALTNNIPDNSGRDVAGNADLYGKEILNGPVTLGQVLFFGHFTNRLGYTLGASVFGTESLSHIQYAGRDTSQKHQNWHQQYNAGLQYSFRKGWKMMVNGGFYRVSFSDLIASYAPDSYRYSFSDYSMSQNAGSVFLGLERRVRGFQFLVSGVQSNFNQIARTQIECSAVCYPTGNPDLYIAGSVARIFDGNASHTVINHSAGVKMFRNFWIQTSSAYGGLRNYITAGGNSAYNTFDPVNWNTSVSFVIVAGRAEWMPSFSVQEREGSALSYLTSEDYVIMSNIYYQKFITLTFKWKL